MGEGGKWEGFLTQQVIYVLQTKSFQQSFVQLENIKKQIKIMIENA